jgi:hypothetical protein
MSSAAAASAPAPTRIFKAVSPGPARGLLVLAMLGAVAAGLLATGLLLWRDPAVSARLSVIVAARRAVLRARG